MWDYIVPSSRDDVSVVNILAAEDANANTNIIDGLVMVMFVWWSRVIDRHWETHPDLQSHKSQFFEIEIFSMEKVKVICILSSAI